MTKERQTFDGILSEAKAKDARMVSELKEAFSKVGQVRSEKDSVGSRWSNQPMVGHKHCMSVGVCSHFL